MQKRRTGVRHVQVAAHRDAHARRRRILQARGGQHVEALGQLRVRVLAVGRREVQALRAMDQIQMLLLNIF